MTAGSKLVNHDPCYFLIVKCHILRHCAQKYIYKNRGKRLDVYSDAFVGAKLTMTPKSRVGYHDSCCGSRKTVAETRGRMRNNKLNTFFLCTVPGPTRSVRIEFDASNSTRTFLLFIITFPRVLWKLNSDTQPSTHNDEQHDIYKVSPQYIVFQ